MYAIRTDRPLAPVTLAVLKRPHQIVEKHGACYFIIGATARDMLMTHVFGIDAGRATRDVDFAIAMNDWKEFEVIKKAFIDSGDFQPAAGQEHRLYYRPHEFGFAYPLDLIPFGEIEHAGHQIAWPPDMGLYAVSSGNGRPAR